MSFPRLQPFYYRDHFLEVLDFLERHCDHLLEEEHRQFVNGFRRASGSAQAVLVRMVNRKGEFFRRTTLAYEEIGDPEGAIVELMELGWARPVFVQDVAAVLPCLKKPELLELMERAGVPMRGRRQKSKGECIRICREEADLRQLFAGLAVDEWVVLGRPECTGFLLYLYFGFRADDLSAFTMRDMGLLGERRDRARIEPAFSDSESARNGFFYSRKRELIRSGAVTDWVQMVEEMDQWPRRAGGEDDAAYDRTVTRLGQALEGAGDVERAMAVYSQTESFPAIERLCRLEFAAGRVDAVRERLERVIQDPPSDEAQIFAEDFYARKLGGRRVGRLTALLREAPQIEVDELFRGRVEMGVAEHFSSQGGRAYWTENWFWRVLFGTVFYDELFGDHGAGVPNEFVRVPPCLRDGSFYERFGAEVERKLGCLEAGESRPPTSGLDEVQLFGRGEEASPDTDWRSIVDSFLAVAPRGPVAATLRRMAKDFSTQSSGFPDLLVMGSSGVKFIEVKGEGDSIRRNQLAQIRRMREDGFAVEVVRARWGVDPDQIYTVVDVETTGGSPARHRLTEVAAVKVQRGKVIARMQQLINPERPIPANITALTGISDEMVAGAPTFAAVAPELQRFLCEGVLVAHNAKFDFGFLRAEFAQVGVEFSRPLFCTVVESRRSFGGLASYRLASLAEHFGIPLINHHRALADAEATAGILLKILEKRYPVDPSE